MFRPCEAPLTIDHLAAPIYFPICLDSAAPNLALGGAVIASTVIALRGIGQIYTRQDSKTCLLYHQCERMQLQHLWSGEATGRNSIA
jgi:hypothetical protein